MTALSRRKVMMVSFANSWLYGMTCDLRWRVIPNDWMADRTTAAVQPQATDDDDEDMDKCEAGVIEESGSSNL